MEWQGKAIGVSLGSLFGPLGAVAGAAAGHILIDRKRQRAVIHERRKILALLGSTLHGMAAADGPVTRAELISIWDTLVRENDRMGCGLSHDDLFRLSEIMGTVDRAGRMLAFRIRSDPALAGRAFVLLLRTAFVKAAPLSAPAVLYLKQMAGMLGIPPEWEALLTRAFAPPPFDPRSAEKAAARKTLGLRLSSTPDDIKKAFREQCMKYHPDRHASLPPEIRELAVEKFEQAKRAYDVLTVRPESVPLWCLAPGGGLAGPEKGKEVVCFICGGLRKLAWRFNPAALRCDACGARLAFERDFAESLLRARR